MGSLSSAMHTYNQKHLNLKETIFITQKKTAQSGLFSFID
jgi:hypothetical protein